MENGRFVFLSLGDLGTKYDDHLRFIGKHVKGKGKAEHLYSALHGKDHFKALRHGSHSFTCNKHHACLTS